MNYGDWYRHMKVLLMTILLCEMQAIWAELLCAGPGCSPLSPIVLKLGEAQFLNLTDSAGNAVKFRYSGVKGNPPNWVVVVPVGGTTPAGVQIGVNPGVVSGMAWGGSHNLEVEFTTVDENPPKTTRGYVKLTLLPGQPAPGITSVVSAASLRPLAAPGGMVTIFGSDLAAPNLTGEVDYTASYPTTLGNTTVTFNGIASPLLYVSPSQINALVPYAVAGQTSVQVVVNHFGQTSAAFTAPLQETAPALFTVSQTGSGQGVIWQLGADLRSTLNGPDNPAPVGAALELYSTGAGTWNPRVLGDITISGPNFFNTRPVSVTIGGRAAKILYTGTSVYQPWGMLQVNAVVPEGVGPGQQPVVLTIGQTDNAQQKVTMAIK
jgi:uncharacterized protein (TIGR03437 family)